MKLEVRERHSRLPVSVIIQDVNCLVIIHGRDDARIPLAGTLVASLHLDANSVHIAAFAASAASASRRRGSSRIQFDIGLRHVIVHVTIIKLYDVGAIAIHRIDLTGKVLVAALVL